jgi:hypothetical protein
MNNSDPRVVQTGQMFQCCIVTVSGYDNKFIAYRERGANGLNEGVVELHSVSDDRQTGDEFATQ